MIIVTYYSNVILTYISRVIIANDSESDVSSYSSNIFANIRLFNLELAKRKEAKVNPD